MLWLLPHPIWLPSEDRTLRPGLRRGELIAAEGRYKDISEKENV